MLGYLPSKYFVVTSFEIQITQEDDASNPDILEYEITRRTDDIEDYTLNNHNTEVTLDDHQLHHAPSIDSLQEAEIQHINQFLNRERLKYHDNNKIPSPIDLNFIY